MNRLSITPREVASAILVFVLLLIGFGVLSELAGWPNEDDGWPLVVVVALAVAALPIAGRVVSYLQASRATVALPGGFKLDFARAVVETAAGRLPENLVAPGVALMDTSQQELDRAAETASEQDVIVADLKDGRAWYVTRLFALAGTAVVLGSPKAIVLIGQKGGKELQPGGWIGPRDLITALTRADQRYAYHWRRAQTYLEHLRLHGDESVPAPPPNLPQFLVYQDFYRDVGDRVIMRIMVNQMRWPDPPNAQAAQLGDLAIEKDEKPPYTTLGELEPKLEPWLVRDAIELTLPEKEQVKAILQTEHDIILALRNGRYDGVIDVRLAERGVLRQLAAQAET
jgi:hypothetical protein